MCSRQEQKIESLYLLGMKDLHRTIGMRQGHFFRSIVNVISHRYISVCAQSAQLPVNAGSPALINALHTTIASAIVTASNTHERKYLQ